MMGITTRLTIAGPIFVNILLNVMCVEASVY